MFTYIRFIIRLAIKFKELSTHYLNFTSFVELAGKTELEQLQVDMIVDCMEDGLKPFYTLFGEKDEKRKVVYLTFGSGR